MSTPLVSRGNGVQPRVPIGRAALLLGLALVSVAWSGGSAQAPAGVDPARRKELEAAARAAAEVGPQLPPEVLRQLAAEKSAAAAREAAAQKASASGIQGEGELGSRPPPREPEELPESAISPLSAFERQVRRYGDRDVDRRILQFGYDIFGREPGEAVDRPVGADYVLGTGDEVVISLWGTGVDKDYRATVDRAGQVRLPEIGLVSLKGLTVERGQKSLRSSFDRLYRDYELRLRLGKVREMEVHVVGRVQRPGRVRVLSVATLFDALAAAGGITKDGTLRKVRVRRRGAEDREADLYAYLLEGDTSVDLSLRPGDAVVVPAVGARVAVAGRVLRPAIYELDGTSIGFDALLAMAGGFARLADRERFQVESVVGDRLTVQTRAKSEVEAGRVRLADGDVLVVRSANPKLENVVYVTGNVAVPGRYAWREGLRVSDVLTQETLVDAGFWLGRRAPDAGEAASRLPEPFLDYALIRRIDPRTQQEGRIAFDLGKAILEKDPREDHLLQSQDTIVVFPRDAFETPRTVNITGAVEKPGPKRFYPGMRVLDLVRMAGGLLPEAHLSSGLLTRVDLDQAGARFEQLPIDLAAALRGEESANVALQLDDSISVKVIPEYRRSFQVTIEGEVRHAGTFTVIPGERLSDLLERAGGFTSAAYLPASRFFRESVRELQQRRINESLRRLELETKLAAQRYASQAGAIGEKVDVEAERKRVENLIESIRENPALGRVVVQLKPLEKLRGSEDDIELAKDDRILVPRQPQEVHVVGAVFNQTALLFKKGLRVRDYLQECGGSLDTADPDIAYVIRADGSADSARHARRGYRWDGERGRYARGDLMSLELFPGDTLVIPYDVKPQLSVLGLTQTVTQILFQAALSAGVVLTLV